MDGSVSRSVSSSRVFLRSARSEINSESLPCVGMYRAMWIVVFSPGFSNITGRKAVVYDGTTFM